MCSSTTETETETATETQAVLSFIHNSGSIATFENEQLSLDMDSDSMCIHGIQNACVFVCCAGKLWRPFLAGI